MRSRPAGTSFLPDAPDALYEPAGSSRSGERRAFRPVSHEERPSALTSSSPSRKTGGERGAFPSRPKSGPGERAKDLPGKNKSRFVWAKSRAAVKNEVAFRGGNRRIGQALRPPGLGKHLRRDQPGIPRHRNAFAGLTAASGRNKIPVDMFPSRRPFSYPFPDAPGFP